MTISEVLSAITDSLTSLKGRAVLDHHPSLRIKTRVLNRAMDKARTDLAEFHSALGSGLEDDSQAAAAAKTSSGDLYYFRRIVPRMLQNFLAVFEQLIVETPPFPEFTFEELRSQGGESGTFSDFNRLTVGVRQFIDNLVVDAYQFLVLEPREIIYQILSSLISFVAVAPSSLQAPIVTRELESVTQEFAKMSKRQRRNSPISSALRGTFSEKAEYLCSHLQPDYHPNVLANLNAVFSFCSEFTHVGYVPTLIVSSDPGGIFLGGPEDCYLPAHENLAKLRHQLLRECAIFLSEIYVPALIRATESLLAANDNLKNLTSLLASMRTNVREALRKTDFEYRIQPIAQGLKEQALTITIDCSCGGVCEWRPPYHEWHAFCNTCGSRFRTFEVSPMELYALSANGIGDVIGAAGPTLAQLSPDQRSRVKAIWEKLKDSLARDGDKMQFAFIGNPDAFNGNGKDISGRVEKVPPAGTFRITAWIAQAAMQRSERIDIQCNCGAIHVYAPPYSAEVITCSSCGVNIGIYVLSGDLGYIVGETDSGGGIVRTLYPLFGSIYKKPQQLGKEQYYAIVHWLSEKSEKKA